MSQFHLTQLAKQDLRSIAMFTEKMWGKAQRNIYLKQFDQTFHLLAKTPFLGKDCGEIKSNYRKFPQGSHVIFYRTIQADHIEIVRILHKSMDVETWV